MAARGCLPAGPARHHSDLVPARQRAWAAQQRQNAAQAKARATGAWADAESSNSDAAQSRSDANQAEKDAADATTAATDAQTAADDATAKAASADAAATRAQAAADQAQAVAKGAAAAKAAADQAVAMDDQAAAKAITDSQNAAAASANAQQDAATAKAESVKAHADATAAKTQAAQAQGTAATAAGFAYATAQAATAASDAAEQVAAPANDALQLGASYEDTDSAAGLAVLTAQASKTVAEQQAAAAAARSAAAQQAAQQAQAAAAAASADAKAAATSAADATTQAAAATASAAQAVASADRARQYADQAQAADAAARQYDDQAAASEARAQADADQAQGDATAARNAATAADSDAAAAQQAATAAATAAAAARQAAAQAEKDAAAAEAAAKDADAQAAQAQAAATTTEEQQDTAAMQNGGATNIPHVFAMARITPISAVPVGDCKPIWLSNGLCKQTYTLTYNVTVDFFYCADLTAQATPSGCPADQTFLVDTNPPAPPQTTTFDHIEDQFGDVEKAILEALWKDFTGDVTKCMAGNGVHCALAGSIFIPESRIADAARALTALDAALKTGIGFEDAYKALKALEVSEKSMAAISASLDLEELEGAKVTRGTLYATLDEYFRRFSLGVDPAKGNLFNKYEMLTALRVEALRGVQLLRDKSGGLEWFDKSGRSYDAMGSTLPAKGFDQQWALGPELGLRKSITEHLAKADLVPVDVTNLRPDQIQELRNYISTLSSADQPRIFLVGEGS